jgi:tRNA (guanine10-N2)-dimethyltransferase
MGRLMFVLSGEHPSLPGGEAIAAIRAERRACRVIERLDQILVVETKADPRTLAARLGMSHQICEHLCTARVDEMLDAVGSSDIVDLIPHGQSFAVRIKRIKRYSPKVDVLKLARQVADLVMSEVGFKVDLRRPDVEVLGVLTDGSCAVGLTAARVDRSQFLKRRPTRRPVFHPGTLMPTLARCMVNLARSPRGGTLLDPFCGVGGILIEAGLIGVKPIGIDIDPAMIKGAERNLKAVGVTDFQLQVGDARKLPAMQVDAIATDPPYGRQATTARTPLEELYRLALPSMAGVLKRRRYICITSPAGLELEGLAKEIGLRLIERHEQRVHKSLTRHIYVFQRR